MVITLYLHVVFVEQVSKLNPFPKMMIRLRIINHLIPNESLFTDTPRNNNVLSFQNCIDFENSDLNKNKSKFQNYTLCRNFVKRAENR